MTLVHVLSLYQPWATLIALGVKRYETRGYTPDNRFRGRLVIHAAKHYTGDEKDATRRIAQMLRDAGMDAQAAALDDLPFGAAVCATRLTAVYDAALLAPKITDIERACGNYAQGRYAWRLEDVWRLPEPLPLRGQRGLFTAHLPLPAQP